MTENADSLFVEKKPAAAASSASNPRPVIAARKNVKKRWMYVALGIGGFALVLSSMLSSERTPAPRKEEPGKLINLTPKDVEQRSWQARSQEDIQALRQENERQRAEVAALREQMTRQASQPVALPAGVVPPPTPASVQAAAQPLSQSSVVPPPPVPASLPPPPASLSNSSMALPPPFTAAADKAPVEPLVFTPPKRAASASEGPEVESSVRYRKNANAGMMVAGSFAPVVMLNGIDAGTGTGARSNPQPVLMRVQENAVLPGSAKFQLRSCFVLGSAYGDLSSERVYLRLARLSCVDKSDRLVLSVPVQGYVVDSDNTLGMRGVVTDRKGALLGKALLAGFAQGLAGALGGAQGTVTTSVLGSTNSLSGGDALRASGLAGASTAASQLAETYLKEAQALFPIITVQGGRQATIVFTEDVGLTWGGVDAQFIRDVQPDNSALNR